MIPIDKAVEHMAWSNLKIFDEISKFPEDIYGLRAAEGEWPVGKILTHFINAAEWFRYCLNGTKWGSPTPIKTHAILLESKDYLAALDSEILAESLKDDGELTFEDENGPVKTTRSLILAQTVSHTAEHKGQLATILKAHGHHLDLDKYDVWSFASAMKKN